MSYPCLYRASKEIKAKIETLSNIGRGLGIHLIFYTQNPLAAKLGSDTKANVSVTIGGRVTHHVKCRYDFWQGR